MQPFSCVCVKRNLYIFEMPFPIDTIFKSLASELWPVTGSSGNVGGSCKIGFLFMCSEVNGLVLNVFPARNLNAFPTTTSHSYIL